MCLILFLGFKLCSTLFHLSPLYASRLTQGGRMEISFLVHTLSGSVWPQPYLYFTLSINVFCFAFPTFLNFPLFLVVHTTFIFHFFPYFGEKVGFLGRGRLRPEHALSRLWKLPILPWFKKILIAYRRQVFILLLLGVQRYGSQILGVASHLLLVLYNVNWGEDIWRVTQASLKFDWGKELGLRKGVLLRKSHICSMAQMGFWKTVTKSAILTLTPG